MVEVLEGFVEDRGEIGLAGDTHLIPGQRVIVTITSSSGCETALQRGRACSRLESSRGRRSVVTLTAGAVVIIRFPFSDLSQSKVRPAVVLADAGEDEWVLCQITSVPYADARAVALPQSAFLSVGFTRTALHGPRNSSLPTSRSFQGAQVNSTPITSDASSRPQSTP